MILILNPGLQNFLASRKMRRIFLNIDLDFTHLLSFNNYRRDIPYYILNFLGFFKISILGT